MTTMKMRFPLLLTLGVVAVLVAFGRNPSAPVTAPTLSPAPANYEYKVEFVKKEKDLEAVVQADARNGWRVHQVLASAYHTDLLVLLEKPSNAP